MESRSAIIHILAPEIPESVLLLPDQTANAEVQFQLNLKEKKETHYMKLYEGDATTITMRDLKPATEYNIKYACTPPQF